MLLVTGEDTHRGLRYPSGQSGEHRSWGGREVEGRFVGSLVWPILSVPAPGILLLAGCFAAPKRRWLLVTSHWEPGREISQLGMNSPGTHGFLWVKRRAWHMF